MFVYFAARTGFDREEGSYYVDNPMTASLLPFKVIKDQDGKRYVVMAAPGVSKIPGSYQRDIMVDLSDSAGTYRATGYIVRDPFNDQLILLALANENGEQGFYVYEGSAKDFTLTPYDDY
ncbi:MAG: hypothetical protein ACSW70_03755, partial [Eubacteriales bacterium]